MFQYFVYNILSDERVDGVLTLCCRLSAVVYVNLCNINHRVLIVSVR